MHEHIRFMPPTIPDLYFKNTRPRLPVLGVVDSMGDSGTGAALTHIVQYWHSDAVPTEIAELTATFRDRNPGMRHLMFDRSAAEELIAERFSGREVAAFRACAVPSMQADYFSYCVALVLGGIYADVGFRCVRSLRPLVEGAEQGTLFRIEDTGTVIHGFFCVKPEHPLLRLALDIATANIEERVAEYVNIVTGPWIFTGLLEMLRTGSLDTPGGLLASDPNGAEALKSIQRTTGTHARLEAAFDGIRVAPLRVNEWITKPAVPPAYKQSELDWLNWCRGGRPIFQ
jgi:hypothetical protein